MTMLRDILVPRALIHAPDSFGGVKEGDCLRGDLHVSPNGRLRLEKAARTDEPKLLVPALVEAHCHLDKCHSIARLGAVGGDLAQAIAVQMEDKGRWTAEDLRHRMTRGVKELQAAGCSVGRSHIDWGMTVAPPVGWHVLGEIAEEHDLTIQRAALTGIEQLADVGFCDALASEIAAAQGGVLGSFLLYHPPDVIARGLANAFAAADRFGLALDFHVDEGLGAYNGLEAICDAALNISFEGPVLCGHAVSLMDRDTGDFERIAGKLHRAGITVCALPTTNLYLQGRTDGTPDRRGLTRMRELHAAGVPIVVGSDNVADAFCPVGQHDPRAALHLAVLAAHLDPPFDQWLPSITTDAARGLGLDAPYVDTAPLDALRLADVRSTAQFLAGHSPLIPISQHVEVPAP